MLVFISLLFVQIILSLCLSINVFLRDLVKKAFLLKPKKFTLTGAIFLKPFRKTAWKVE